MKGSDPLNTAGVPLSQRSGGLGASFGGSPRSLPSALLLFQLTQWKVGLGCGSPGPLPNREMSNMYSRGEKGTALT